jgi:hypothetical protein
MTGINQNTNDDNTKRLIEQQRYCPEAAFALSLSHKYKV